MKPEKKRLIRDVLSDPKEDTLRQTVLLAGGSILCQRRRRRAAGRLAMVLILVLCAVVGLRNLMLLAPRNEDPQNPVSFTSNPNELTDEELLDLFQDTPVGLATIDGKKRLIFPHPGDEERFVRRF